jgi:16S rRNA (guanine966-N2)-methyltransferase
MRVVAGRLRGRTLAAPPGDATRPTGARAKEALFAILSDVSGLRVLDLYAGSGALGIEALSRGATFTVFVEAARPALACLRENLTKLGLEREGLSLPMRVAAARAQLVKHGPFDLVLCDPPWKDVASARDELEQLARAQLFAAEARIVLEHSAKAPPREPAGSWLVVVDQRRWGDTAVTIYQPAGVPGSAPERITEPEHP